MNLLKTVFTMQPGDRVKMTPKAFEQRLNGPRKLSVGTFRGWNRSHTLLKVHRDGRKGHEVYHPSFWEPIDDSV